MPIVFAAITPHPPVLIPEVGKDNFKKLAKTKDSFKKLEQDLYATQPESLVIISPHGLVLPDAFSINLSSDYVADFKEFGDFSVAVKAKSDYLSIQAIRASDETQKAVPIVLTSNNELDHGFGVPLYYLSPHLKDLPIIPITPAGLDLNQHFAFGGFLHRQLSKINKRFAIIASADLSHRLSKKAPGGYSKRASEFDQKIQTIIKDNNIAELLKIDPKLVEEAGTCGLQAIAIFAGIIESMNFTPQILSYEKPFGVGYLLAEFQLQ